MVLFSILVYRFLLISPEFKKLKKNRIIKLCFISILLFVQIFCWQIVGLEKTKQLYPLFIHSQIVIFLVLYFKRTIIHSIISVTSAYLCCQVPRWTATVGLYFFDSYIVSDIFYIMTTIFTLYLLEHYAITPVLRLTSLSKRSLLLFGAVPSIYYLFDYATTIYTDWLYSGVEMAVQFMPSIVATFYFVFVILYYSEIQKRMNAEQDYLMMTMQIKQATSELSAFHELEQKTKIYRHDMRHHLLLIENYLTSGNSQMAIEYIKQIQSEIHAITPNRYCKNSVVNFILSSFQEKARAQKVTLSIKADLPEKLSFPDTQLCTLLSNSLENAIQAAAKITEDELKTVHIICRIHKNNLLICIENNYSEDVIMKNGLPQSSQEGHGFGVKSIEMIVDQYHGIYSFSQNNGIFTLKIALPLGR